MSSCLPTGAFSMLGARTAEQFLGQGFLSGEAGVGFYECDQRLL